MGACPGHSCTSDRLFSTKAAARDQAWECIMDRLKWEVLDLHKREAAANPGALPDDILPEYIDGGRPGPESPHRPDYAKIAQDILEQVRGQPARQGSGDIPPIRFPVGFEVPNPSWWYGDDFRRYILETAKTLVYDDQSLRLADVNSEEVAALSDVDLMKRVKPILTSREISHLKDRVRGWWMLPNRNEIERVLMTR